MRVHKGHGIDLARYPAVAAWSARIAERPSAKVRLSGPDGEPTAFTREQFSTLMRSGPE